MSINSSLFRFSPLPDELLHRSTWYEEGKIHRTLTGHMVRSKSEVIIANMLCERGVSFDYEVPAYAPDGTLYLPDFTITWNGEKWRREGRRAAPGSGRGQGRRQAVGRVRPGACTK